MKSGPDLMIAPALPATLIACRLPTGNTRVAPTREFDSRPPFRDTVNRRLSSGVPRRVEGRSWVHRWKLPEDVQSVNRPGDDGRCTRLKRFSCQLSEDLPCLLVDIPTREKRI